LGISHLGEGAVPCTSHFCHSYPDADAIISRTYFNSRIRRRKKKEEERIRKKNREKVKFLTIFSSILLLFFFYSSVWFPVQGPYEFLVGSFVGSLFLHLHGAADTNHLRQGAPFPLFIPSIHFILK